ncbi:hypothetical protein GW17_00007751 [Ensete ventricosum]|nr:hypothetical protein GW17_00007751 [Ensete ventricosum]
MRSLNPFVEAMEMFVREAAVYTQQAYPQLRLGVCRILAVASARLGCSVDFTLFQLAIAQDEDHGMFPLHFMSAVPNQKEEIRF